MKLGCTAFNLELYVCISVVWIVQGCTENNEIPMASIKYYPVLLFYSIVCDAT